MKSPPRLVVKACIQGERAGMTFCDRVVGEREFVFDDFGYAAKVYDARLHPRTPIVVCEECANAVRKRDVEKT
jgi:hypothetical protein